MRLDSPIATPLADAAAAHGVRLAPGPWFGVDGTLERYLRLPFTMPPHALTEAARRLAAARALASSPGSQAAPYGSRAGAPLTPTL